MEISVRWFSDSANYRSANIINRSTACCSAATFKSKKGQRGNSLHDNSADATQAAIVCLLRSPRLCSSERNCDLGEGGLLHPWRVRSHPLAPCAAPAPCHAASAIDTAYSKVFRWLSAGAGRERLRTEGHCVARPRSPLDCASRRLRHIRGTGRSVLRAALVEGRL